MTGPAPAEELLGPREDELPSAEDRLARAVGGGPLRVAFVVLGALVGLHLLWTGVLTALGRPVPEAGPMAGAHRVAVTLALLVAFLLAVPRWVVARDRHDLRRAGWLPPDGPEEPATAGPPTVQRRAAWAGAGGAAAGLATSLAVALSLPEVGLPTLALSAFWLTPWTSAWVLTPLVTALVLRALVFQLHGSRVAREAARSAVPVDLLDLRRLHVAGRMALRNSLLWIGGMSIALLLLLDSAGGWIVGLWVAGVVTAAVAGLVAPVLGLRDRIRAEREAALAETEDELRLLRDRERAGRAGPDGRVADLLAWHRYVSDLSDWPYDATTRVRFALFLLIPLGSWLAGAVVEELVGRWLPG